MHAPAGGEWTKAVISTTVGFVAAVTLEPLRSAFTDWDRARKMRRKLYRELARNFSMLCHAMDDRGEGASSSGVSFGIGTLPGLIRLEYFAHAIQQQDIYADVADGAAIRATNNAFAEVKNTGGADRLDKAALLTQNILSMAGAGLIDRRRLAKYAIADYVGDDRMRALIDPKPTRNS